MINNLLYYTTYILNSRIYPPNNNWKFRSAIIPLIEPLHSNYKPIEVYNMGNSFSLNYQTPRKYLTCLIYFDSFTRIPLICANLYETCIQKVFNQKNTRLYFTDYIYIMQILKQTKEL